MYLNRYTSADRQQFVPKVGIQIATSTSNSHCLYQNYVSHLVTTKNAGTNQRLNWLFYLIIKPITCSIYSYNFFQNDLLLTICYFNNRIKK